MQKIHLLKKAVFLGFITSFILACGGGMTIVTATPVPPTPTYTVTLKPTSTPLPTLTEVPPTATPATIGSSVTYNSLEITVLGVKNRESIHFGDVSAGLETFYKPLPGKYLIDVGVLVRNLSPGHAVRMTWSNIFIVEADGDAWYPGWGNMKTVNIGKKVDPFVIGLSSTNINGDDAIEFDNDTYLRLIFSVTANPDQDILFAIGASPVISIQMSD